MRDKANRADAFDKQPPAVNGQPGMPVDTKTSVRCSPGACVKH
ncbi:hypothetical protein [Streptomyces phaeochromogenes]